MTQRRSIRDRGAGRYQPPPAGSVPRWAPQIRGIDVFWPVAAVVLTTVVVLVSLVANSSMAAVGDPAGRGGWEPVASPPGRAAFVIVQVASDPSRTQAQAAAARIRATGPDADVLRSDDYYPLNPGWYVVFVGPFDDSAAGRARAEAVSAGFTGSLVRIVRRR